MAEDQEESDRRGPDNLGSEAESLKDDVIDQELVSVEALSSKDLQDIVGNPRYRHILSDLLSPYLSDRDTGSGDSADHTDPDDQSE